MKTGGEQGAALVRAQGEHLQQEPGVHPGGEFPRPEGPGADQPDRPPLEPATVPEITGASDGEVGLEGARQSPG